MAVLYNCKTTAMLTFLSMMFMITVLVAAFLDRLLPVP